MIHICLVRSHKLKPLQNAIAQLNKQLAPGDKPWGLIELERFDVSGMPISRIAFLCDGYPPKELDIPIEATFNDFDYCLDCFAQGKLNKNCDRHAVKIVCPSCYSKNVVKNGRSRFGKQRWLCRDCGRRF